MDECHQISFKVNHINQTTRPSLMSRNLIHFTFFLKINVKNYYLVQDHSPNSPSSLSFIGEEVHEPYVELKESFTKSQQETFTRSSSSNRTRIALHEALEPVCSSDVLRTILVNTALDEFCSTLREEPLCRSGCFTMDINFEMESTHEHIYYSWDESMVPAAESSVRLLKKIDCADVKDENCCICFEDFWEDGRLLSMPCEHAFHGGCIEKWLSNSHYCPLCRFEMPT